MKMDRYNPREIEEKWRGIWEKNKIFRTDLKGAKKPFYNLMMFPYPSGEGLHVGHVYSFGGSDTYGKLKRLQGWAVFEPMGFDSFGIHSENYAIKTKTHPRELIDRTTKYFREGQLKKLGALFDWDHQVITSDREYYRWTQWLFVQLYKAGLVERKKAPIDWCPSCKTVLADEQVIDGRCERCHAEVIQKELEQWFFKITTFAEKLLNNLNQLDWAESTKTLQRNWIGRSEGVIIKFPVASTQKPGKKSRDGSLETGYYIEVFTTRPDTIYGATFMVIAPEHPLALKLVSAKFREATDKYITKSKKATELERVQAKTGVFTGAYCINPFTKREIPIWVADYVLGGYGTGAIMAVPAHDQRDYLFAKKYQLPIVAVISGGNIKKEAYLGEGRLINSDRFNGLGSKEAVVKMSYYIEKHKLGKKEVNYHLRDWLISRQRYWGPPIPMIFCESCAKSGKSWFTTKKAEAFANKHQMPSTNEQTNSRSQKKLNSEKFVIWNLEFDTSGQSTRGWPRQQRLAASTAGWYPVPEEDLPVELPYLKDYQPKGKGLSPLAQDESFVNVACPECGKPARRETDVSDTFLDSSWYFLRYPFVGNDSIPFGSEKFVARSTDHRLQTIAKKEAVDHRREAVDIAKKWLPVDMYIGGNEHAVMHLLYARFITMALHDMGFIDFEEPFKKFRVNGLIIRGGAKMSKSRGNVVNPNEFIDSYGADTLRMYLLFMGPFDLGGDFSDRAIAGVYRFLNRVWELVPEISKRTPEVASSRISTAINRLIAKVATDVDKLKFNTAIAAIMEFTNLASRYKEEVDKSTLQKYLIVLSIFAPFTAEELWSRLVGGSSVHQQAWPMLEEKHLQRETVTIAIQVNGKLRDTLEIQNSKLKNQKEIEQLALRSARVKNHLKNRAIKRIVYVPAKIVNIVVEEK